jgi:Flp pilus assembly protein TadB
MIAALLAASTATTGLALLYRLLAPARTPLAADLARLLDPVPQPMSTLAGDRGRIVEHLTTTAERRGWIRAQAREDLVVLAQGVDSLVARSVTAAVCLGGLFTALGLALAFAGIPLGLPAVLGIGVVASTGGLLLPTYLLRDEASGRREELRVMLPGFLDLAGVLLAAGNSLESALRTAAAATDDWPHQQVRHALYAAAVSRQPASEALRELGTRLAVDEFSQLGDGLIMAEREGAAMRESLAARARGLRERHLADIEAKAGSATEGMSFPLVAFVFGFVLLIGYPALIGLSTGLGSR